MIEKANTWTHLAGVLFGISCIWMIVPAYQRGWEMALGVLLFVIGMTLMFLSSSVYHAIPRGKVKRAFRKVDHISIYVMIACSYAPVYLGVVGGRLGWTYFILLWGVVLLGTVYKLVAIGRFPRLSLAIYLLMGWSILPLAPMLMARLSTLTLSMLIAEGAFYTLGTYFFAHDTRSFYHAIWHLFVLLGAMAHTSAVVCIVNEY